MVYDECNMTMNAIDSRVYLSVSSTESTALLLEDADSSYVCNWRDLLCPHPELNLVTAFSIDAMQHFVASLVRILRENPLKKLFCCVDSCRQDVICAAFLLGCYMLDSMDVAPDTIWTRFESLKVLSGAGIDGTTIADDVGLSLCDLWGGFYRAKQVGWVGGLAEEPRHSSESSDSVFIVIPGRLVALQPPTSPQHHDDISADRSPCVIARSLAAINVNTLVRLAEAQYQDRDFEDHGIACVACETDELLPPPSAVRLFLHTLRTARGGAVAVHCDADLQRTGTFCALHLMSEHGFGGREASAWIRIVCPGMIASAEQVEYLAFVGRETGAMGVGDVGDGAWWAWRGHARRGQGEGRRRRMRSPYGIPAPSLAVSVAGTAKDVDLGEVMVGAAWSWPSSALQSVVAGGLGWVWRVWMGKDRRLSNGDCQSGLPMRRIRRRLPLQLAMA